MTGEARLGGDSKITDSTGSGRRPQTFGNPAMTGEARLGGDSKITDSTGSGRRPQTFGNPAMTGEARLGGDSSEPMRGIFVEEPQEQSNNTTHITPFIA